MSLTPSGKENLEKLRGLCKTNGLRVSFVGVVYIFILPIYTKNTPYNMLYSDLSLALDVDVLFNPNWEEIESEILEHSVKTTFSCDQ